MAAAKLVNLIGLLSIVLLALSFAPAQVEASLAHGDAHNARRHVSHQAVANKRRQNTANSKRCKVRSSTLPLSSSAVSTSSVAPTSKTSSKEEPKPTSSKPEPSSTPEPKPTTSKEEPKPTPTPTPTPPPATTTKKTEEPKPTTSKSSGGNSGGDNSGAPYSARNKLVVAFASGNDNDLNKIIQYAGFVYTWSPWIPTGARNKGAIEMPQLWGNTAQQKNDFVNNVKAGYGKMILAFNEPDEGSQSAMDPGAAAALWKQFIEPHKNTHFLVGPATTNAPRGRQWYHDFLNACNGGCSLDAIATHIYTNNAQDVIDYHKSWHDEFNLPLILTETACQDFSGQNKQCSKDQIFAYAGTVTKFCMENSYMLGCGPFGFFQDMNNVNTENRLVNSDGTFNDLGWVWYNGLKY